MIRPVSYEDLPQLELLMKAYIVDFYEREDPGSEAIQQLVQHLLDHPEQGVQFVYVEHDILVGFATLYFTFSTLQAKRSAILNDLFVKEGHRGKGLGEALFRHCLHYIRAHAFVYMQWETAQDNKPAQALYAKMGGELCKRLIYEIE